MILCYLHSERTLTHILYYIILYEVFRELKRLFVSLIFYVSWYITFSMVYSDDLSIWTVKMIDFQYLFFKKALTHKFSNSFSEVLYEVFLLIEKIVCGFNTLYYVVYYIE